MTKAEVINQALRLSEPERLALAEELWASVEDPNAYSDSISLPQWQQDLLDHRLEESQDDPGQTWAAVKAEIWPSTP